MRRKMLLTALLATALALPVGVALGAGAKKKSTYELHGMLSLYTAAVDPTPGSITILVTKSNKAGRAFVGQTLVFPVAPGTKIEPTGALIADGDTGSVQVKGAPGLDGTALQLLAPKQVVDETLSGDE